ncbi:hypothetical protein L9F63_008654, partial [Diploptera punctata]
LLMKIRQIRIHARSQKPNTLSNVVLGTLSSNIICFPPNLIMSKTQSANGETELRQEPIVPKPQGNNPEEPSRTKLSLLK